MTSHTVAQSLANEQLRQAILNKKRVQIEAWNQQIEQLQKRAHALADSVRASTEDRLRELAEARDQAVAQFEDLQDATQDSWETLLQRSDEVFQDLADRFHRFTTTAQQ